MQQAFIQGMPPRWKTSKQHFFLANTHSGIWNSSIWEWTQWLLIRKFLLSVNLAIGFLCVILWRTKYFLKFSSQTLSKGLESLLFLNCFLHKWDHLTFTHQYYLGEFCIILLKIYLWYVCLTIYFITLWFPLSATFFPIFGWENWGWNKAKWFVPNSFLSRRLKLEPT